MSNRLRGSLGVLGRAPANQLRKLGIWLQAGLGPASQKSGPSHKRRETPDSRRATSNLRSLHVNRRRGNRLLDRVPLARLGRPSADQLTIHTEGTTMDPYTAERLVAYKQAELIAEARQAALDRAWAQEATEHMLSIRAIGAARSLLLRAVTQVWNGGLKGAGALGRADR